MPQQESKPQKVDAGKNFSWKVEVASGRGKGTMESSTVLCAILPTP
jgi:hypothetical protein